MLLPRVGHLPPKADIQFRRPWGARKMIVFCPWRTATYPARGIEPLKHIRWREWRSSICGDGHVRIEDLIPPIFEQRVERLVIVHREARGLVRPGAPWWRCGGGLGEHYVSRRTADGGADAIGSGRRTESIANL